MAVARATFLSSTCSQLLCSLSGSLPPRLRGVFLHLSWGWLLCLGRPTVANLLRSAPTEFDRHWTCAHCFFSRSQWLLLQLFRVLVCDLLAPLFPAGTPWVVIIDDTTAQKYGRQVAFAGTYRDGSASTLSQPVCHWSHQWVLACVLLPLHWAPGRKLHIPVLVRLYKKPEHCARDEYRTHGQLALALIRQLQEWLPQRRLQVVADPLYVGREFLTGLPSGVAFVSGRREALPPLSPLRTVHASFPAYGSSLCKTPCGIRNNDLILGASALAATQILHPGRGERI